MKQGSFAMLAVNLSFILSNSVGFFSEAVDKILVKLGYNKINGIKINNIKYKI